MTQAYDELVDFIVSRGSPRDVIDFRASEGTRERVRELVARLKQNELTGDEKSELDMYTQLNLILTLAKAKARLKLGNE